MLPTPGADTLRDGLARVARLADSERARKLDVLEHEWNGTQYDARPSFWDKDKPVQTRAPCIIHPVARIAGNRVASIVFGESRFPKVAPVKGPTAVDGLAVADLEAAPLSEFLAALIEETSLKLRAREMVIDGCKQGTAVIVASIKAGMPRVDLLPAKWCTPSFDPSDADRVVKLVYQYRHADPDDKSKSLWYRREIGETSDREWRNVECDPEGRQPEWESIEPTTSIAIEFCPVVWARNLPDSTCTDELDGIAIHEGLRDEIEALDLAHSMRHRNALYNGDPLPVISGAGPEDVEAPMGQDVHPSQFPRNPNGDGTIGTWVRGFMSGGAPAIKKGPGSILYITNPTGSASLLESSGAGNKILGEDAEAIRKLVFEAMSVVVADPATFGTGDLSARALVMLFRPMLDLADNLRECWGKALRKVIGQLLRLCAGGAAERDGLFVRGIATVRPILRRFAVPLRLTAVEASTPGSVQRTRWVDPPLAFTWGPYFEASTSEVQAITTGLGAAVQAGLISRETATKKLMATLNLDDDIAAEMKRIDADRAATQAAMGGVLGAMGGGSRWGHRPAETPTPPNPSAPTADPNQGPTP